MLMWMCPPALSWVLLTFHSEAMVLPWFCRWWRFNAFQMETWMPSVKDSIDSINAFATLALDRVMLTYGACATQNDCRLTTQRCCCERQQQPASACQTLTVTNLILCACTCAAYRLLGYTVLCLTPINVFITNGGPDCIMCRSLQKTEWQLHKHFHLAKSDTNPCQSLRASSALFLCIQYLLLPVCLLVYLAHCKPSIFTQSA